MMLTALSVNLNKICLLRNSRGGERPRLLDAAQTVIDAGAAGLTLHPRPDRRHATVEDCIALGEAFRGHELNLEGNPFAAPRPGYPGFIEICALARPAQATLVPDGDGQLTSDHGFDLGRDAEQLAPVVARLRALGCRVSVFVDVDGPDYDPGLRGLVDRVELYTGPYASAYQAGGERRAEALTLIRRAITRAQAVGLGVNAGHDLDLSNLAALCGCGGIAEVSIGHALIADALELGLQAAVRGYLGEIARGCV